MSRIAAILRKEGKIIPPLPIALWDDFCLSNLLTSSSKYEVLIKEQVETELFETLSDIEHNSLVLLVMIELEKKNGIQTPWNGAYLEENIRDLKLLLTGLKNVQSETGAEEALLVVKYN